MWKAFDADIATLPRSIRLTDSIAERGRLHRALYSSGRVIHSLRHLYARLCCFLLFCVSLMIRFLFVSIVCRVIYLRLLVNDLSIR